MSMQGNGNSDGTHQLENDPPPLRGGRGEDEATILPVNEVHGTEALCEMIGGWLERERKRDDTCVCWD